jgi:UDP-N-acetylmuramoyl-tripeptide--D-alanyl-D-alanine ligase
MVLLFAVAAGLEWPQLEECAEGLAAARSQVAGDTPNPSRITVLDDTYNANPDSMDAALIPLARSGRGPAYRGLGRMGELGEHAAAGYQRVGRNAAKF